jgi:hypothetical protein
VRLRRQQQIDWIEHKQWQLIRPTRVRTMPQVVKVPIPAASKVLQSLKKIDFGDAYQASLSNANMSVHEAYAALFGFHSWWVRTLFSIRNIAARALGLQHAAPGHFQIPLDAGTYRVGQRVGMFVVHSIELDELIVGASDKHLDVRISFFKSTINEIATITVTTVVETHNNVGRMYMFFVGPVHSHLAPSGMRKSIAAGRL